MYQQIQQLSPTALWYWFTKVSSIPRPSSYEKQVADYIVQWAQTKGIFVEQDKYGNLLLKKPATVGMEQHKTVLLQAHLDMVPQADEGVEHDFLHDPLDIYIDGDWITAKGTTLGADNGLGLASCLAILDADNLVHPALEVILTVEEETGMQGAFELSKDWVSADILINVDTEESTSIYLGCAGGIDATLTKSFTLENANIDEQFYQLKLSGLAGGHSGVDIHLGRANAIKLLARCLAELQLLLPVKLVTINGGVVRNTIPREAYAVIVIAKEHVQQLNTQVQTMQQVFKTEFTIVDPNLQISLSPVQSDKQTLSIMDSTTVINLLNSIPNGVITNSTVIANVVETSNNLGIVSLQDGHLEIHQLIRSLIESGKEMIVSIIRSLAQLVNMDVEFTNPYPGWAPNPNSNILTIAQRVAKKVLGKDAELKVIHAGLECGVLQDKYPQLEIISIGPTVLNAHTPNEKLSISSSQDYWQILTGILAEIPVK